MHCPRVRTGSAVDEQDPIPISRLSHAGYCLRRAALLTNEQLWVENADTARGRAEHERVHTDRVERRGDEIKLFEHEVFSRSLGLYGRCDCIEATADAVGCRIPAADFPVRLYPIEYKHGKVRSEEEYELQLCAQAMCLEEMYVTSIPKGAVFYITSHRRYEVELTQKLRDKVRELIGQLNTIRTDLSVPSAGYGPKCKACSMKELCMPSASRLADKYCEDLRTEAKEDDIL